MEFRMQSHTTDKFTNTSTVTSENSVGEGLFTLVGGGGGGIHITYKETHQINIEESQQAMLMI